MRAAFRPRFALTLALLAAAPALTHAASPQVGPLAAASAAAETALAADAPKLASAKKTSKLLAKASAAKTLAAELKQVAAAAKLAEGKLADQTDLLAAFTTAAGLYGTDLLETRALLVLASESPTLSKGAKKKAVAALGRFDKAGPQLPNLRALGPLAARFKGYAAAAKAGSGYTPYDEATTFDWVIQTVDSAPAGEGVDLDGDGTPDDALGGVAALAGFDVGDSLSEALAANGGFALLEMWYVKDVAKPDPFVLVGTHPAVDADADAGNNFTGSGVFAVPSERPEAFAATTLAKGGKYVIELGEESVQFASITLPAGSKLIVKGTATATTHTGSIGVGIPIPTVVELLAATGTVLTPQQQGLLSFVADLDLDAGVPGNDALSVSLAFEAVAATKVVVPE